MTESERLHRYKIDNTNSLLLPSEILLEVYIRLPYKSLVRLKTVCKTLYNLTSRRYFINEYRKRRPPDPSTIVVCESRLIGITPVIASVKLYDLTYDNYNYRTSIDLLRENKKFTGFLSSYGLVCLYGDGGHIFEKENRNIAICSPTNKQIVHLPDYPNPLFSHKEFIYNQLGFGFHPEINKYKIVQLVNDVKTTTNCGCHVILGCNILTLELESSGVLDQSKWKYANIDDIQLLKCNSNYYCNCHDPKEGEQSILNNPAVCVQGVLYWEICSTKHIILFDLRSENMKMISCFPRPSPGSNNSSRCHVGFFKFHLLELQGNLCFWEMLVSEDNSTLHLVISRLNHQSDCSSYYWSRLYTLKLQHCPDSMYFFPLCIMADGRRLLFKNLNHFYSYDTRSEEESCSRDRLHHFKMYPERGVDSKFSNYWFASTVKVHAETTIMLP